ncbi:MAG TPA: beta-ketoacyl synthase N-terminal-like domain-containing protein [Kofleriaceae bacterium]|jgi:acyl transferase domain-containing protein/acyl-CoA synthetase (AMP-forming)/AMP-acid ligase II/acyl carrier protein|nr:beta-ketoacyl synthase N-terminal-like domain-containing protein [Kofleriaceae bacterium]
MSQPVCLFGAFARHLESQPDALLYRYLVDGDPAGRVVEWTYAEAYRRSAAVAALVSEHGLAGKQVLLLAPPGLDYITTFLGCLMARVVIVPAYPPVGARTDIARLVAIATAARIDAVVTTTPIAGLARSVVAGTPLADVPWLATDTAGAPEPDRDWLAIPARDALAYLQFTSGSTSDPKGVMVTHGNIAHNSDLIRRKFGHTGRLRGFSWLPPYHDMGLIGGVLQPLYVGGEMTLMSPLDFLKRPIRWIESISRFRVTTSGGPDFSYALCARRFRPGATPIDLSSWRVAFNGAEPIRPDTLDRFCDTFGPHGFSRTAFYPCYGLAEATLIVTGGDADQAPVVARADRDQLARGRFAEAAAAASAIELVSCGTPAVDQELAVVDPYSHARVAEGVVGEIWITGPSVTAGYWNRPDATAEVFAARRSDDPAAGPYARTGDLGFVAGGELYITGRHKDLIIVRGRNLYPHDIEGTVAAAHPAIRAGCVAAFSTSAGTAEGIAVAAEVQGAAQQDLGEVVDAIRRAVTAAHDVGATEVVLLPARGMPKTSSGKLTRAACRAGIADGSIACVARWRADLPASVVVAVASEPEAGGAGDGGSVGRLRGWLRDAIAERTGLSARAIATGVPLVDYGVDSQMAVEIAGALEAELGRPVPATLAWNHPTIDAIAAHLAGAADAPAPAAVTAGAPSAIAIIAVGCRFPGGADSPEAFWRLLCGTTDPIGPVPASRWTHADHLAGVDPARGQAARLGGFVDRVDEFDAAFFAISPREAESLDPQQRLLLEVCYETLDRAGRADRRLAGSSTGVFVGISSNDYYLRQQRAAAVDPLYSVTGNLSSVAAGRVSYALGLVGPSLAVDTACSSSLLAVHLACQSLRAGECEQALAGGVNLILGPEGHVYFSAMHATSPRGRCATFDASADGYVRSEGCGMVLCKPLEAAQRDGDRILAVIRGSAVNHDGRSNGLTAPNGRAQEAVIRRALASAAVRPEQVGYVEAHGTGTPLGDPIEVQALAAVYGAGRPADAPLRIGSTKSRIGHAEAAAGIASLIKTALALDAETLPGNLHFATPNPQIRWAELPVAVVTEAAPWPRTEAPRLAGVSSFGFSGTNVHLVLEQAPVVAAPAPVRDPVAGIDAPQLIAIAGHTPEALDARLAQVEQLVQGGGAAWIDVAHAVSTSSSHLACRAAWVATPGDVLEAIERCRRAPRPGPIRKLAFAFTGQGAQRAGMGMQLAERWPIIADTLQGCDAIFRAETGLPRGLREVMWAAPGTPAAALLDRTDYTQAALFALEYALFGWWRALGCTPDVVLGHSIGEIAAACAAGVMDPAAAMRLVVARGQGMCRLPPGGAMVSVGAAESEVAAVIGGWPDTAIAAVNGPRQVVVAGPEASIARVVQHAAAARWQTSRLAVSHAFHCPLMAGMVDEFGRRAAEIRYRAPRIPLISAVTGALAGDDIARAEHWTRHVLAPVRFDRALAALPDDVDAVVELGPQPVLTGIAQRAGSASARRWIPCARPGHEAAWLLEAAAALYEGGVDLDLSRLFPAGRPRIALPGYPWQRRRYWIEAAPPAAQPAPIAPAPVAPAPVAPVRDVDLDPALDLVHQQLDVMRQQLGLLAGELDSLPNLRTLEGVH